MPERNQSAPVHTLNKEPVLPNLTPTQIRAFEQYARLEISINEFQRKLAGLTEFCIDPDDYWMREHFRIPKPGIKITREHIENAVSLKRRGGVEGRDIVCWSSLLLMSDVYEFDSDDMDFIGDSLTALRYGEDPSSIVVTRLGNGSGQ
jgi:hypothetical protein